MLYFVFDELDLLLILRMSKCKKKLNAVLIICQINSLINLSFGLCGDSTLNFKQS